VNSSCSAYPCTVCGASNNCPRLHPLSSCCLASTDCSATPNPCLACNTVTAQCYAVPGCCNLNSDCGTDPCIECTSNQCVRKAACCESSSQCGACSVCNSTYSCVASPDPNCCTVDSDCGSCRRCAVANNGTKTCVAISDCCLAPSDCETCQNCSDSQCVPIDACCNFDYECSGCDVCSNFTCVTNHALDCCQSDLDCATTEAILASNPETAANVSGCGYTCNFGSQFTSNNSTGVCQPVCTSGKNWTGLIVGLAAGVPLGLLALCLLAAALAAFLYKKRDMLSGKFLHKGHMNETGLQNNAAYETATNVHHSPL